MKERTSAPSVVRLGLFKFSQVFFSSHRKGGGVPHPLKVDSVTAPSIREGTSKRMAPSASPQTLKVFKTSLSVFFLLFFSFSLGEGGG